MQTPAQDDLEVSATHDLITPAYARDRSRLARAQQVPPLDDREVPVRTTTSRLLTQRNATVSGRARQCSCSSDSGESWSATHTSSPEARAGLSRFWWAS